MTTQPYQGYPYVKPHVTDAPSVDAATASRWANLPRRQVQPPTTVVYVELPDEGGSQVVWRNDTPSTTKQDEKKDPTEEDPPVIYIDVQDSGDSEVTSPVSERETNSQWHDRPNPASKKTDEDLDTPVIYIDLPGSSTSDVTSPAETEDEPEFVEETIFYDPFENRRVGPKEAETDSEAGASPGPARPAPRPALRPMGLALTNTTGHVLGSSHQAINDRQPDSGLPTTIPVSQFPEPPPAYSEINTPHTPHTPHITPRPPQPDMTQASDGTATPEPPRTVVITPGSELRPPIGELPSPVGLPSPYRKVVDCQFCGLRVHSLVIWEAGPITHAIAVVLSIFMLLPAVILVYCTNTVKYKNHYCPNCNKKIGYEVPCACISMTRKLQ